MSIGMLNRWRTLLAMQRFNRAQTCQPEGDSRSGFLPAGLPSFPVPRRAQRLLVFSFDYSACVQPITSASLAAYCSASFTRAEFFQRVRRLLTGGSLRPACALGGNRLASLFQDEVLQQHLCHSTARNPAFHGMISGTVTITSFPLRVSSRVTSSSLGTHHFT